MSLFFFLFLVVLYYDTLFSISRKVLLSLNSLFSSFRYYILLIKNSIFDLMSRYFLFRWLIRLVAFIIFLEVALYAFLFGVISYVFYFFLSGVKWFFKSFYKLFGIGFFNFYNWIYVFISSLVNKLASFDFKFFYNHLFLFFRFILSFFNYVYSFFRRILIKIWDYIRKWFN